MLWRRLGFYYFAKAISESKHVNYDFEMSAPNSNHEYRAYTCSGGRTSVKKEPSRLFIKMRSATQSFSGDRTMIISRSAIDQTMFLRQDFILEEEPHPAGEEANESALIPKYRKWVPKASQIHANHVWGEHVSGNCSIHITFKATIFNMCLLCMYALLMFQS